MEWILAGLITIAVAAMLSFKYWKKGALEIGQPAPDFELMDQHGHIRRLADYQGKWLALYFYPKDDTPGCTRQACAFRDDLHELSELGAEVLGVSLDNIRSHTDFSDKYQLHFPLLFDQEGKTALQYHSLINLGFFKFAKRNTFLIGPDNKISRIYWSANPRRNSNQVIEDLKYLQTLSPGS